MSDRNLRIAPPPATAKRQRTKSARLAELEKLAYSDFVRGVYRLGLTLEQLARECGCDRTTAWKYLAGERKIPASIYRHVMLMVVANENGVAA